ncbi:hypothetical protein EJ110_NYTH47166 [Nymphaea thermarum]|nr:hypothetical protein EJ110_NYTH47166 [Nymphaea thermarum]
MVRQLLAGGKRDEREDSGGGASGSGGVLSWGNAAGVLHHVASTPPSLSSSPLYITLFNSFHSCSPFSSVDGILPLPGAEEANKSWTTLDAPLVANRESHGSEKCIDTVLDVGEQEPAITRFKMSDFSLCDCVSIGLAGRGDEVIFEAIVRDPDRNKQHTKGEEETHDIRGKPREEVKNHGEALT